MCYVYAGDIYCDGCAALIKREVAIGIYGGNGLVVGPDCDGYYEYETVDDVVDYLDSLDERDYDSGDYPKYGSDDEACDSPQHCGSGPDCVNAIELSDGSKCGDLIGNDLTADGVEYVKDAVRAGGVVADLWRDEFDWIDFDDDEEECDICGHTGPEEEFDCGMCADCQGEMS